MGVTTRGDQSVLLKLSSGITPGWLSTSGEVSGIKPRLAFCKASPLPSVLSLQLPKIALFPTKSFSQTYHFRFGSHNHYNKTTREQIPWAEMDSASSVREQDCKCTCIGVFRYKLGREENRAYEQRDGKRNLDLIILGTIHIIINCCFMEKLLLSYALILYLVNISWKKSFTIRSSKLPYNYSTLQNRLLNFMTKVKNTVAFST